MLIEGRPFHAHEVFEDAWKSAGESERDLWRGLAQVAVGLTHARRGNALGAVALLRRGAGNLSRYAGPASCTGSVASRLSYGVDATFVASCAAELAAQIERDGLAVLPAQALLLRLRPYLAATVTPLVAALGGDGVRVACARCRVAFDLGGGEREARVLDSNGSREHHPVDGAVRSDERAT